MTIKVLHLSMPRTGSLSMKSAYKRLGMDMYHGFDYVEHPELHNGWEKAIDAKWYGKGEKFTRQDWDTLLGDWDILSDFPVVGFAEDLIAAYPEAKVVIVERDIDTWYKSFEPAIINAAYTWQAQIMANFIERLTSSRVVTNMMKMEYGTFSCNSKETFKANAKQTYRDHYAMIRRIVPKERLLDYRLGSGWEPLCQFLGKPVPDEPFPHMNESTEFAKWMKNIQKRELKRGMNMLGRVAFFPFAIIVALFAFKQLS